MKQIAITVALLAGCGGDDEPDGPPLVDCGLRGQCELECVDEMIDDTLPSCRGVDFAGNANTCGQVAVYEGRHGCCMGTDVQRWFECEP